jgi:hypothetical protein
LAVWFRLNRRAADEKPEAPAQAPEPSPCDPSPAQEPPTLEVKPLTVIDPAPLPPAIQPELVLPHEKRVRWVKPKGLDLLVRKPHASTELNTRRAPRVARKRLAQKAEKVEEYGQYYFRDQILDQLDHYFIYLKRMKARDPSG